MPNVAGHPTMDASTGMANGVKRAIPKQAPASLKTKLLKGALPLAAGARSPMPLRTTARRGMHSVSGYPS